MVVTVGALVRRPVVWVDPDATLQQAASLLTYESIGAALVRSLRGGPAGIISERDVVRSLADGEDPARTRVRDVMTEELLVVPGSTSVVDALRALLADEVRHLVVAADDAPLHIVSWRDVVAALDLDDRAGQEVAP
jgi:CBS domain-containing protein